MWLLKPLLVIYHLSLLFSAVFAQDTNVADEPRQKLSYQVTQVEFLTGPLLHLSFRRATSPAFEKS